LVSADLTADSAEPTFASAELTPDWPPAVLDSVGLDRSLASAALASSSCAWASVIAFSSEPRWLIASLTASC
jgi:hypothetical protein